MLCDLVLRAYVSTSLPMYRSTLFYVATLPWLLHIFIVLAMACSMFRVGPQVVFHHMYSLGLLCVSVLPFSVWYLGFLGPQQTVPWNSRLHFFVVAFLLFSFVHLAAAAGSLPGEHPSEPRTSIFQPVYRAIFQTLRITDAMTDLSLIGELFAEVRF